MAVVMVTEVPGADAGMVEGMRQAGVLDAMAGSKGFRGHWSGTTSSGYRVIEVWDSRDDWQAWYEGHIVPNLPPGAEPNPPEFFELNLEVKPSA
jgi:heme-degrading monooxygenase HmoA